MVMTACGRQCGICKSGHQGSPEVLSSMDEVLVCVAARGKASLSNFCSAPLYLVRSGNYNYSNGSLNNQANNMNYWSATASSATNANNLNANPTNWNPQNSNNRGNGRSVRCVAR